MKTFLKVVALLGICSAPASAAIVVTSTISDSPAGVRTQAVIENTTTFGQQPLGVAVKEFRGTIIVRDNVEPPLERGGLPGLLVKKSTLTAAQAYGSGLPMGYLQSPFTDPEGPWQGLTWPYRDQYDYFSNGNPQADDIGTPFTDQPDVYGFVNIVGIARGGPTDPVDSPGNGTPQWLDRGLTGNGLNGPATYFNFDIIALSGAPDRYVRVRVVAASAVVVQRDAQGVYSEVTIPVADSGDFFIRLPEPGSATLATIGLGMLMSRRRRK
ncbi:hypothetical protein BH09PLA1_BH09PLA1_06400 [soil metagenome]